MVVSNVVCLTCGSELKKGTKYCSHKCYSESLKGHIPWNKGKVLIPRGVRYCKCGCGTSFECLVTSDQRYIKDHQQKCMSQESIDKRAKSNTIPRETRTCICGCKGTFICREDSDREYIHGHNSRCMAQEVNDRKSKTLMNHEVTQETRGKISKSQKEYWKDPEYRDRVIKAIMSVSKTKPNKPEKLLFSIVDKLFPDEFKLNVKGEHARPGGKLPDIVNLKDKLIIEHYGDLWHANKEFCKAKKITEVRGVPVEVIRRRNKQRIKLLESLSWKVLIVWEHELKNIDTLIIKLVNFIMEDN